MKKTLLSLAAFSLILAACQTAEVPQDATPQDDSLEEVTYTWEEQGISFFVPEGLVISESSFSSDALYLDTNDMSNAEGDYPGQLSLHAYADKTLETLVADYSSEEDFAQEEVEIEGNTFTKITFHSVFADYDAEVYAFEANGKIYTLSKSWTGSEADLETVLYSLTF